MSYQISYTPECNKRYPIRRKKYGRNWIGVITVTILVAVCLFVAGTHLRSRGALAGNENSHEDMLQTMLDEIRAGTPFQDAVTAFCKEVLKNG